MADGALAPLSEGVLRRRRGQEPTDEQVRLALKNRWKALLPNGDVDLHCWNGKSSERPECNWVGSQNIPFYCWAVLADWRAIAACCRVEAKEGNFGRENGSVSSFYHGGVIGCKLDAERELTKAGLDAEAADVKRAIRSNLAWSAIAAVSAPRLRDEVNEAGKWRRTENPPLGRRLTVPVAGMRWSIKGRSKMTSEDSPSETLANELAAADDYGLTLKEAEIMRRCIAGDAGAAKDVAWMMFGTIETTTNTWKWRFRRTTEGGEALYLGQFPNGLKPMRVVTQVTLDGTWRGMRPSPEKQNNKWATGFEVEIKGGVIHARCVAGEASLPELGGEVLWQVDVEGSKVYFNGAEL